MKFFTSGPMMALAIFLGAVQESFGMTQLSETLTDVTITTEANGFPTQITFVYSSDFGAAVATAEDGKASLVATGGGDYTTYYTGNPAITVDSDTAYTIDLSRNGDAPADVADYSVTLSLVLSYTNGATLVKMDEVVYTFDINIAGTASSVEVISANAATTDGTPFAAGGATEDTVGSGQIVSSDPGDLVLAQDGAAVAFGADIVLLASTASGTEYTIWVDPTEAITADNVNTFNSADAYEWPNAAATSSQSTETAGVASVTVTLKSPPVSIYDMTNIFVKLTVHFRDESNDAARRRALRTLEEGSVAYGEGSAEVVAKVTMASDGSGAVESVEIVSFLTASALAGVALVLV